MASTILTNWKVYYADDAGAGFGYKQIKWDGGTTGTNTLNELYSELMHLFDNSAQNNADDSIPLKAVTPTLYEIGSFDAGDKEAWYIDPVSVQHLTGGGLNTVDWTYVSGSEAGIFKIPLSSLGTVVDGDVGAGVTTSAGSMTGTLLHVDTVNTEIYIRPTSSSATHDWTTVSSGTITCNAHTCTQNAAGATGENIYANIYSIGTIADDTELYVAQNNTLLTQWWATGHIDILVLVSDQGTLIDTGLLDIYARQYSTLYDIFSTTVATGGRNPIPLATADDINNDTGYRRMTVIDSSGVSDFDVGNYIYAPAAGGWSAATKKGVISAVAGTATNPIVDYYLIGDLTDFVSTDTVKEYDPNTGADGDGSLTAPTPTNTGIASLTGITFTFGAASKDLGNGNGFNDYDVVINCGGNTIADFYEYTKYVTRRGSATSLNGNDGEQYITTGEIRIPYDGQSANFTEGSILTGQTSGATGVIVADHDGGTTGTLIVRGVRGTFDDTTPEEIRDAGTPGIANVVSGGIENTTISKTAPFGTFAGGKFFGARGVWLETGTMHANDANNYSLLDSDNVTQDPPSQISVVVGNLVSGDKVTVFRANTDGTIDKTYLPSDTSANSASGTTWTTSAGSIPTDTPSSGVIKLRDFSTGVEERIAYTSWTGLVFTLGSAHSGGYTDANDSAYVPYVDEVASGSSVSQSVTYATDRTVLARVRITGVVPFSVTGALDSTGYSVNAIRNPDNIFQ